MGKRCCHFFSAILDRIYFILTGNDHIHERLDEFEIWPDPTTGFHGNRYGYNGKNGVATFSLLFFIRSFSYLQVMMTCMRAWMSSNCCQIRILTAELAALERLKKPHRLIMGKLPAPQISEHSVLNCSYICGIFRSFV